MKKKTILEKIESGKIAKFTDDTKASILIRDKHCIICEQLLDRISPITDYHHVYFGSHQAEYNNPLRNATNRGVGLCRDCHYQIHHGSEGKGDEYRNFCITYLQNIYGENYKEL